VEEWTKTLWDLFKLVAPWLTGGLAGATLTYLLNQRIARRKQARVLLTTERVDYSIAASDKQLKDLRVSYKGDEFDNLLLYQVSVENVSARTIQKTPFLLIFDKGTVIVDQSSLTYPLARDTAVLQQPGHECAYLWDSGELKPRDSARLRLLLAPTTSVDWTWRGDDDVEVTSYGREGAQTVERELRNVIVWISFYILVGGIPLFSGMAHAIMLILSIPYIVYYCMRWWPLIPNRENQDLHVVAGNAANVAIAVGAGRAVVAPASTDQEPVRAAQLVDTTEPVKRVAKSSGPRAEHRVSPGDRSETIVATRQCATSRQSAQRLSLTQSRHSPTN
jgi:hypothetical protein